MHDFSTALRTSEAPEGCSALAGVARRGPGQESIPEAQSCPQRLTGGQLLQSTSISGQVYLDWLEWTVPVTSPEQLQLTLETWDSLLGGSVALPVGGRGYSHSARVLEHGKVLWNPGRLSQGVHVSLPSSALELLPDDMTVDELLGLTLAMDGKFTRLDVAMDTDQVTMGQISAAVDDELVKKATKVTEYKGRCGDSGHTIYVGSRKGRRYTRFYDKAAEQGITDGRVWTRCEVEHKAEYAQRAAELLLDGVDPAHIIAAAVDFRSGDDENVSRRPRSAWWAAWLGGLAKRVSFAFKAVEKSVQQVYEWLKRQVAPSLALLAVADPDWRSWAFLLIDEGFQRIPAWRRQRARRFNQGGFSLGGVT